MGYSIGLLDATKEKKATSTHTSLMIVALNFFNVHVPRKKGLAATIIACFAEEKETEVHRLWSDNKRAWRKRGIQVYLKDNL